MVRYSSPGFKKSVSRMRSNKSRVIPRNRLSSPLKKLETRHTCTCKSHYHSTTSDGSDISIDHLDEDQFNDLDDNMQPHQYQIDDDGATDSDWDEQATLIALLDDEEEWPDFSDRTAIVDRLQPAFDAHRRNAKQKFRNTLVPVISLLGETHKLISYEIHTSLLSGASLFDKKSRIFEDAARREQDQLISTYARMKEALEELSFQLQDTCAESDKLVDEYEKAINEHVQRLRDYAKSVSGDIERLISKLDKMHKSVAAEDHAKSKEKLLRGILDKY